MGNAQSAPTRIVVVNRDDGATITDCLDGLAAQGIDRIEVVVVDLDSADGGADAAIHHPVVARVVVTPPGNLDRILALGSVGARSDQVLLLRADQRPEPGWLDSAQCALASHVLVRPPGAGDLHLGVQRSRLLHLSLDARDAAETDRRVRDAGFTTGVAVGMGHVPARRVAPRPGLPAVHIVDPGTAPVRFEGRVSVVVCTRARPEPLATCLASLARLDDSDHEILVVDNGVQPTICASSLPPRARIVHEPRRGLDHARNRGMAEATGEVLAYVDDDCEVDPSWITALRVAFGDPDVQAVTGRVRPASLGHRTERWFEAHFSFDRGTTRQRFTRWDRRPWYPMWPGGVGAGCNMAFRRSTLEGVGGFDPLLDMGTWIGGGGDLDVFARLLDQGTVIEYRPDALVWHHHRTTPAASRKQFFGYGVAVGALLTKTVLDRPGLRWSAGRFFLDRLQVAVRLVRRYRSGVDIVPTAMVLLDVAGQLAGPFVYLAARLRSARHAD
jgi:GT2 family glycosyltransferase